MDQIIETKDTGSKIDHPYASSNDYVSFIKIIKFLNRKESTIEFLFHFLNKERNELFKHVNVIKKSMLIGLNTSKI